MKSYLKFLSRNKLYTAIEAVGLVLSLAFVIILGSYAWQQYAAAHSTPDGDRVYALGMPDYLGLTYGMPEIIKDRVPEVEAVGVYCPGLVMQMKEQEEVEEVSLVAVNEDFSASFPTYISRRAMQRCWSPRTMPSSAIRLPHVIT